MTKPKPKRECLKSHYSYISPDRKRTYFVQRCPKLPLYYGIYDDLGNRIDSDLPQAIGLDTAEDAQALLDAKAVLFGWVSEAEL